MLESGSEICPCQKAQCERHGKCEECIAYHRDNQQQPLPYCKRKPEGKK
jgi:hypothetical protein